MTNLLRASLAEADIARILQTVPRHPLLPPLGSERWRAVAANPVVGEWMRPLRELAAQEVDAEMPTLSDASYRSFHEAGARLGFESAYFERRRRVARAAICALIDEGEAREMWLRSMEAKLGEIFQEASWALPAHVKVPSGKDPMEIDLFSAETANMMAEALDLFGAVLSPDLVGQIKERLHVQAFRNYVDHHDELHWTRTTGNWNAVCHQGVIGAALAAGDDFALLARMLVLARKYLPLYLNGFASDGACLEGPGYWQYGFGWFCALNEQLEIRTDGQLSLFEGDAHVREIARYGPRITLSNFHFVNFSDSPRTGALSPTLLTYLGRRLEEPMFLAHGYRSYQRLSQTGIKLQAQRTDLFYLTRLLLYCPSGHGDERAIEAGDFIFRDAGMMVARGRDRSGNLWEFAAKAGHNAEPHNHNDCGSYIINLNGAPIVAEIGAPEYTRDYFREKRYEYLAARTLGHSLPIVNGHEQAAGPQYAAKLISAQTSEDSADFSVELTACYPQDAQLLELVRSLHLDKQRGLLRVTDSFELARSESFQTALITEDEVTVEEEVATIQARFGKVLVKPVGEARFAGVEKHEYRDHGGAPRTVFRLIFAPSRLLDQRSVAYEIEVEKPRRMEWRIFS